MIGQFRTEHDNVFSCGTGPSQRLRRFLIIVSARLLGFLERARAISARLVLPSTCENKLGENSRPMRCVDVGTL